VRWCDPGPIPLPTRRCGGMTRGPIWPCVSCTFMGAFGPSRVVGAMPAAVLSCDLTLTKPVSEHRLSNMLSR
jgi:hypothetical protein